MDRLSQIKLVKPDNLKHLKKYYNKLCDYIQNPFANRMYESRSKAYDAIDRFCAEHNVSKDTFAVVDYSDEDNDERTLLNL